MHLRHRKAAWYLFLTSTWGCLLPSKNRLVLDLMARYNAKAPWWAKSSVSVKVLRRASPMKELVHPLVVCGQIAGGERRRPSERKTYGVRTHSSRIHPLLIHVSCLTEWINGMGWDGTGWNNGVPVHSKHVLAAWGRGGLCVCVNAFECVPEVIPDINSSLWKHHTLAN